VKIGPNLQAPLPPKPVHINLPCYVMEQLHEMTVDDTINIVMPNGYLYHLEVDKEQERASICGEH
jgi:hypothetical protein